MSKETEYIPLLGLKRSDAMNNAEQKKELKNMASKFDRITKKAKESYHLGK